MTADTEIHLTMSSKLGPIVFEVWDSFMLSVPEAVEHDPGKPEELVACATICLSGAWNGVLMVECEPALATRLSGALLGIDEAEVSDVDVADTLGEVANVMGGNLKNILPGPTLLSLPVVATSLSPSLVKDAFEVCRLRYVWEGGPMQIVVWSSEAEA